LAKIGKPIIIASMATMNISLTDDLKTYVEERVASGGYLTSSEYMRELIRDDQGKHRLRQLLLEGAASPPAGPADDAWFEELNQRAIKYAKK
jgi:antitoxin ParD1/3/4